MEKDLYKANYLQKSISMLTEENLELLEKHCIKDRKQDIGRRFREHEIVFELIQAYKEQQAELEKKDKIIDELEYIFYNYQLCEYEITDCTYRKCEYIADDEKPPCRECIKQYFERKVEDDIK